MVQHGGSSAGSYLTNPASSIPSHCAVIVFFESVPMHQFLWLVLLRANILLESHKSMSAWLNNCNYSNEWLEIFMKQLCEQIRINQFQKPILWFVKKYSQACFKRSLGEHDKCLVRQMVLNKGDLWWKTNLLVWNLVQLHEWPENRF